MLPAFIERVLADKEEEQPIDECRISMPANTDFIQVTHYMEVPGNIGGLIEESKKNLIGEVRTHLPECINIQTLPIKRGKKSVMCSCLTLQVDAKNNRVEDIERIAEMAELANLTVIRKISANTCLANIHKDMKPYE